MSSALVKRLKATPGGIRVGGEDVFTNKQVMCGDELELTLKDVQSKNIEPKFIPLDIIYEDEDIIALNKPRSMPTHPSQNHHDDTLANGVMYYFKNDDFTFRVITRLDRDTSGIVLVAKNAFAAARLGDDMKDKKIHKEYIAVVNGTPSPSSGRIVVPIKRVENSTILRCVSPDGKEAITDYELLVTNGSVSLIRLIPHTGRTHQLRVHMSHIGNPIYGDVMYGASQTGEKTRLHCASLTFAHPVSKKIMKLNSPLPCDMAEMFEKYENILRKE